MKESIKYSVELANRLTNQQRRLEDSVAKWVRLQIDLKQPLRSWECYAAMMSGSKEYPASLLGLEEIRDLGGQAARQRWHQLFGDVCRNQKQLPIFPAKKGEGSNSNANVGFLGPQASTQPKPTAQAPAQKVPAIHAIAEATQAMSPKPDMGGMA